MSHDHNLKEKEEENLHECKDGACAIDYTKEVAKKETVTFNKEYIIPTVGLFFLLMGIGFDFYDVPFF